MSLGRFCDHRNLVVSKSKSCASFLDPKAALRSMSKIQSCLKPMSNRRPKWTCWTICFGSVGSGADQDMRGFVPVQQYGIASWIWLTPAFRNNGCCKNIEKAISHMWESFLSIRESVFWIMDLRSVTSDKDGTGRCQRNRYSDAHLLHVLRFGFFASPQSAEDWQELARHRHRSGIFTPGEKNHVPVWITCISVW